MSDFEWTYNIKEPINWVSEDIDLKELDGVVFKTVSSDDSYGFYFDGTTDPKNTLIFKYGLPIGFYHDKHGSYHNNGASWSLSLIKENFIRKSWVVTN